MHLRRMAAVFTASVIAAVGCLSFPASADSVGDVNMDGAVDSADALLALRASVGIEKLSKNGKDQADVNNDGRVDSSDALKILRFGLIKTSNVCRSEEAMSMLKYDQPKLGVDVSFWDEEVDFDKLKAKGFDFVIIRAGGATDDPSENHAFVDVRRQGKDSWFDRNYSKAKEAGLHVGAYWYSFATTDEEALHEAQSCLRAINGKRFDYPIYFDLENDYQLNKGKEFCTMITETFCKTVSSAGYYTGFYMSSSPATDFIDESVKKKYDFWVAQWDDHVDYNGTYGMWQCGLAKVDGITEVADINVCYVNYPAYIKGHGLNGN